MTTRLKNYGLVCLTAALLVLACALTAMAQPTIHKGVLLVGTDLTYPPYNYFNDANKPAGFDVELMTALAKKAGYKVKFLDTRFENLILGVNGRQFDVIASTLYVKPERAKKIEYVPYMKTGVSIAVKTSSNNNFVLPQDLCGHTVGSIKGGAWIDALDIISKKQCHGKAIDSREFPSSPEVTQALLSGGVDAQMEDSAVLQAAAAKLHGKIRISSQSNLYPVVVGYGVRKGNIELVTLLKNTLKKLEKDGTYYKLLAKYNVSQPSEAEFEAALGK